MSNDLFKYRLNGRKDISSRPKIVKILTPLKFVGLYYLLTIGQVCLAEEGSTAPTTPANTNNSNINPQASNDSANNVQADNDTAKNRAQTILEIGKYIAPSSKFGNMIRFKKPKGSKDVEIRTKFDEWAQGFTLIENSKNPNVVEIDIKELGLPEGRYEFKFVIDGEFEEGYNRILWVEKDGLLSEPRGGRPILREESNNNVILSFLDNNYTFLEITHSGDKWKTRSPLRYDGNYWNIDINTLDIKEGTHRYKLIRDGDVEGGADRLIHISNDDPKKIVIKDPKRTKILKNEEATDTLKAINPNTTYLAIKTSANGWGDEIQMEEKDGVWELKLKELSLPKGAEGEHEFKFVTSEGIEAGENRKLIVDKNSNVIFPKPWVPVIVKTKKPSSILYFKTPPNEKIELVSSADGWSKRFETKPVKNHKGIFSINTKDLGLPEGKTAYKFVIDGEFEGGADRLLWLDKDGKIYYPEPKEPIVWDGFEPYPALRVQDDQVTSLRMKHSGDGWNEHIPFENINGIWQIDISKLNLPPGVYEYKLERNYEMEGGANRLLNIIEDNRHVRMDPKNPGMIQPRSPSPLLIVNDPNTKYLAIKHEQDKWEKEYPFKQVENNILEMGKFISPISEREENELGGQKTIRFRKPKDANYVEIRTIQDNWEEGYALSSKDPSNPDILEIDISKLKLKEGKLEYKFVIDGEFEWGPNRFVWIDEKGLIAQEQPSVQGRESFWVLNTQEIGLKPGRTEFKLVNSSGLEGFNNRVLHISDNGNIMFPLPEDPTLLNQTAPSDTIEILAPNNPDIGISHDGDNWGRIYKLTRNGDIWFITNKELELQPGEYLWKIRIGDSYEPGADRKLTVRNDGKFLFVDEDQLKIDRENALIKIKAPKATSLQLRHTEDWSKTFMFEKDKSGEWILDSRTLGIPKEKRIFFKLIIDEKLEEGPDRAGYINEEGKFIIEKPPIPEATTTSPEELSVDDPYFGLIRKVNPNPSLSLKGKEGWYNSASIYHIWVPSFRDSQKGSLANDNIGDLRGITEVVRSGYFNNLGIETLWLSPIFQSGDEDEPKGWMHGYETKDFYQINKNFGTKADFEELLREAHGKGIRIVLEFVPNHVGDKHPWFLASSDPSHKAHEKFKDWFIWEEDPIEEFTLKAWHKYPLWTKSEERGMYYYHIFSGYLPDLNYRNPEVVREMANIAIYWLNLGVDGFRVDANKYLFENFENNDTGAQNQPETIEFYQELSRITDQYSKLGYPKVMMAENWTYHMNEIELYGRIGDKKSFDLSLDFMFLHKVKWSIDEKSTGRIIDHLLNEQPKNIKYVRFLSNHDLSAPRAKSHYESARGLATNLNILLPGPYVIYYGEEIDMEGNDYGSVRNQFQWDLAGDLNNQKGLFESIGSIPAIFDSNQEDAILEIGKYSHPSNWKPKDNKTLRFKKPLDKKSVGIRTSNDNWESEATLQSKNSDEPDILEIDISELNLKEGRVDFKFLIDGEWETGPNRYVWIDDSGLIAERQLSPIEEYQEAGQLRSKYKEFFESESSEVISSQDGGKFLIKYTLENRQLIIVVNVKDQKEYASIFTPQSTKGTNAKTGETIEAVEALNKESNTEEKEFKLEIAPYGFAALLLEME